MMMGSSQVWGHTGYSHLSDKKPHPRLNSKAHWAALVSKDSDMEEGERQLMLSAAHLLRDVS